MSDTPRTDAAIESNLDHWNKWYGTGYDVQYLSRTLERELSEIREKLETARVALDGFFESVKFAAPIYLRQPHIKAMFAALSAITPEQKP